MENIKQERFEYGNGYVVLNIPENFTNEQRECVIELIKHKAKQEESLYVMYESDCGCEGYETVLLDRFPMSEKIMHQCHLCKKGIICSITQPPIFYLPLLKQKYTHQEMSEMLVTEGRQKELIEAYQELFKNQR